MPKPNDKHAKELARKARKLAAAKAAAGDPWVGVPLDDAQLTCVASGDLKLDGQCGLSILRTLPGGRRAVASFLIDRGVLGLKDAWGYADSSLAEFNEMLAELRADGLTLSSVAPDAVRALVAGGVRYATEYGFRVPKDWPRWAGLLGGVGDWRAADTRPFRPEYAETVAYARAHLVGQPAADFFARPDVTFVFPDGEAAPPIADAGSAQPLTGDALYPTPADVWVEPTRDDYAGVFRLLNTRRKTLLNACLQDLAAIGKAPGVHVEADAVAVAAAATCIAKFGRPPAHLRDPAIADPKDADLAYFYARLLEALFARPAADPASADVLRATCRAIRQ